MSSRRIPDTLWRSPSGEVVACVEKLRVLKENLEEIQQLCYDALEDAVLMGCDEQQVQTGAYEACPTPGEFVRRALLSQTPSRWRERPRPCVNPSRQE